MNIVIEDEMINLTENFDFVNVIREIYDTAYMDGTSDEPFYICDIGDLFKKNSLWQLKMPRVEPYYAMKCNPNDVILKTLAKLQIGFDCASQSEIELALRSGVPADRIIYANPCKPVSHIKYAKNCGVNLMTFDNIAELEKIAQHHPEAIMVMRIFVGATKALCPLGLKFGTDMVDVEAVLQAGKNLNINIIGVSFHVGSGCFDATAYETAISLSREVFDIAKEIGYNFSLLDIGGGFPGNFDTMERVEFFERVCKTINQCLEKYFPDPAIRVISEPGRYYVSSAFQLACSVTSIRSSPTGADNNRIHYFLNDGVYGSFNCRVFDHYMGEHYLLNDASNYNRSEDLFESILWGPTCDSFDKIVDRTFLRKIEIGECVVFKNMGAYTMAAGCTFNGFPKPSIKYYCDVETWKIIETLFCCPSSTEEMLTSEDMMDSFEIQEYGGVSS